MGGTPVGVSPKGRYWSGGTVGRGRSHSVVSDLSGTSTRSRIWAITSSTRRLTGIRKRSAMLKARMVSS